MGRVIDRLGEFPLHRHAPLAVIGPHHVKENPANVLHPFVKSRPDVFQRHLGVGLQYDQRRGIFRLGGAQLGVRCAKALLGIGHGLVDEGENLIAHLRRRQIVSHLIHTLPRLQTVDADGLTHLVAPSGDHIRVVNRLGEGHELQMAHGRCEHGVNEDLVGHKARHQRPAVVLVFLLFPIAPGDGIAVKARGNVLVDHGIFGGFRDKHLFRLPLHAVGTAARHLFLMIKVDVEGLAGFLLHPQFRLAADAGHLPGIAVGTDFPAAAPEGLFLLQMRHRVPAHQQNIRLTLHLAASGVAEHHVGALHQLHADFPQFLPQGAAVGPGGGVEVEVGAVVAASGPVEKGLAHPIVKVELLQKVLHRGVCHIHRPLIRAAAAVDRQGFIADGNGGACEARDKKAGYPL